GQRGEATVAELARQFQISRKTAYKMIDRFETMGWDGLKDLSRASHHHPNAVSEETQAAVVALRQAHPTWGPKKLRARLRSKEPHRHWPAESTIGELLDRCGLVRQRRPPAKAPPRHGPF